MELILAWFGIGLAIIGISGTVFVAFLVDRKTRRLFERIGDIQTAEMPHDKYLVLSRLLKDKRGNYGWIKQNAEGKWIIVWELEIKEGIKI